MDASEGVCRCGTEVELCGSCQRIVCKLAAFSEWTHDYLHASSCQEFSGDGEQKSNSSAFSETYYSQPQVEDYTFPQEDEKVEETQNEPEDPPANQSRFGRVRQSKKIFDNSTSNAKDTSERRNRKRNAETAELTQQNGSRKNSRRSVEQCAQQKLPVRRQPAAPEACTPQQITYLTTLAVKREKCTCFDLDSEFSELKELYFNTQAAAEAHLKTILEPLVDKETKLPPKNQVCDAYTILEKNNKFLILKTNSQHSLKTKAIESKCLRPMVQPEIPNPELKDVRFYIIKSCPECNKVTCQDTLVIDSKTDLDNLHNDATIKKCCGNKADTAAYKIKKYVEKHGRNYRFLFIKEIQPNETKQPKQVGWSLHHSEMESYFFSKLHGWTIKLIVIDRDCCLVCGATLGSIADDVHKKILFYNQFLKDEEVAGEIEEKAPQVEEKADVPVETPVIEEFPVYQTAESYNYQIPPEGFGFQVPEELNFQAAPGGFNFQAPETKEKAPETKDIEMGEEKNENS